MDVGARTDGGPAALEAAGRTEEALALLVPAGPAAASPAEALVAARCLLQRPAPVDALPWLEQAARATRPGARGEALTLLGRTAFGLGLVLRAARAYAALTEADPAAVLPRLHLARCQMALGWPDRALATLAPLPRPLPGWWESWLGEMRRDLAAARREALRALARRRGPKAFRVSGELVLALLHAGRVAAAQGLLAQALAARPGQPGLRIAAAALALRDGGQVEWPRRLAEAPVPLRLAAARTALQAEDLPAAAAALEGVSPAELPGAGQLTLAQIGLLRGRAEEVAGWASALQAAAPQKPWPSYLLLTAALHGGAVPVWRHAIPATPARMTLVQFWHTAPPPDVAALMDGWQAMNPDFELARFDAVSGRAEVAAHAPPGVLAAYDAAHHPAMQSDILRLVALHRRGGLYVDADEHCLRPVPDLAARLPGCLVAAPHAEEVPHFLYNGILLAEAGSPVLAEALAAIAAEIPPLLQAGQRPAISNGTGPGLLTRIVARRLAAGKAQGIAVLTPRYWRSFARTAADLAYKATRAGDWRQA